MVTTVLSAHDGPRTTVADLVNNPLLIPARILDRLKDQFLTTVLLRDGGSAPSDTVLFEESEPLFLDGEVEDVAEFAEIPVAGGQAGVPRVAVGVKKGVGVRISREMRDFNKIDKVNRQIRQQTNSMIRSDMVALRKALENPAIPTIAASKAWTDPTALVRRDIANAQEVIAASVDTAADEVETSGFEADTIVVPSSIAPSLQSNDNFMSVYKDSLASESIAYTGKLPGDIMGMLALRARFWFPDRVLVLERGTTGFYSDPRPLESTGLYPEGNGPNGGPTESWRNDTTRIRILGIDQPLSACWITGVTA